MIGISSELLITMLGLSDLEIESTSLTNDGDFIVSVKSTLQESHCHQCGRSISQLHYQSGTTVRLRHLPVFSYPTYIEITPSRYQCNDCHSTTTQQYAWYEQRQSCTKAYQDYLLLQLINSTIKDVSIKESIGYDTVEGVIERSISSKINWTSINSLGVMGIDEVSIKKGHKDFVVIVTAYIDGKLTILAVLNNREKSTVKKFFLSIPKRLRRTVKAVCSDLYTGFINAAKEVFGKQIPIVADRFHVAKLYRTGLDSLRKKEMKRLKKELSEKEYKKLFNIMWLLRQSFDNLSEDDQKTLNILFSHSPDLRLAYDLTFDLTRILDSKITPGQGKRKIRGWVSRVKNSGLTCFNSFLKTVINSITEITNYFINRHNSGFVEGLNNKIKVIKRRCYGLTNITHLFQRIYLDMEGYSRFSRNINNLQNLTPS